MIKPGRITRNISWWIHEHSRRDGRLNHKHKPLRTIRNGKRLEQFKTPKCTVFARHVYLSHERDDCG